MGSLFYFVKVEWVSSLSVRRFDPQSCRRGRAHLEIVANGIASDPVEVHVK
jgi:hypothetical protein